MARGGDAQGTALSARKVADGVELGPCGLCGRPMIGGPSIDRHHLVPKAEGGRHAVWMHRVCHRKIHSLLTEKELARDYHTFEALRGLEELQAFIRWIQKKDPEFVTRHRSHSRKRR
ncbi:MAG: HNH endonuclease [Myxococcota bacterium]